MPITTASCCICGIAVIDHDGQPPWMAQFNVIYAMADDSGAEVCLSEPGRREQTVDVIDGDASPLVTDADADGIIELHLYPLTFGKPDVSTSGVPTDEEVLRAWGYPFHSACWKMLSLCWSDEPVPLQLLSNFCRSFPAQQGLLNWGHDYGGLVRCKLGHAPGEEFELRRVRGSLHTAPDPLHLPALLEAFDQIVIYRADTSQI